MNKINIGLLGVDSIRTRAYISVLTKLNITLEEAIILSGGKSHTPEVIEKSSYFNNQIHSIKMLQALGTPINILETSDINDTTVVTALNHSRPKLFIYSGSGGSIIKNNILSTQKQFLHIHPGILPEYRGSTTIYYSLLKENKCGASGIILDENIDTGPVIASKEFPPPDNRKSIDYEYDPYVRSALLSDILTYYLHNGRLPEKINQNREGFNYYIMHPLLRHITMLSQSHPSNSGV
ncbi:MAG TPA: hypothetical protein DEZ08_04935 [Dehalococcoidia bacterium]|jgi:methionyl-tRNA formyltransferase|nr:hypothetical protein [Dehalococcoidia bacterium]|tara:strand:+ start:509 stop:1219 length:711 start_codon:yes stop_codon:yes gene_type:complete